MNEISFGGLGEIMKRRPLAHWAGRRGKDLSWMIVLVNIHKPRHDAILATAGRAAFAPPAKP